MREKMRCSLDRIEKCEVIDILQKKEFEMLCNIDNIFQENNIEYFLACGTALGCVRHQGFIPWDDDVDIYIRGEDYEKVKQVFVTKDTGNLVFQDYSTIDGYPYPFPKIVDKSTELIEKALTHIPYKCGIYIDVFLLSDLSDRPIIRFFEEFKRYFFYCLIRAYYYRFGGIRSIANSFARRLVDPVKAQKAHHSCCVRNKKRCKYTMDTGVYSRQGYIKKEVFKKGIYKKFCCKDFPVPTDYKTYLEDYYGDYMKLPPREERVSGHMIETLYVEGKRIV